MYSEALEGDSNRLLCSSNKIISLLEILELNISSARVFESVAHLSLVSFLGCCPVMQTNSSGCMLMWIGVHCTTILVTEVETSKVGWLTSVGEVLS